MYTSYVGVSWQNHEVLFLTPKMCQAIEDRNLRIEALVAWAMAWGDEEPVDPGAGFKKDPKGFVCVLPCFTY